MLSVSVRRWVRETERETQRERERERERERLLNISLITRKKSISIYLFNYSFYFILFIYLFNYSFYFIF